MKYTTLPIAVLVLAVFCQTASAESCPRTLVSGAAMSPPKGVGWYGTESLAVLLKPDGVWTGLRSSKLWWAAAGFKAGEERNLRLSARALDGDASEPTIGAPTHGSLSAAGGWAMLTWLEFPRAGCWEVTGEYQGQRLSFVVDVRP